MQRLVLALGAAIVLGHAGDVAADARDLPSPLVYLGEIDASIEQDMRYAGPRNFTGARVPGYEAPECILTRGAAAALKRVQAALAAQKYALRVYDCYRPVEAVKSFVRWVSDGKSTPLTKTYMPKVAKRSLIEAGYIASRSMHSTGRAVDLTIVPLAAAPSLPPSETQQETSLEACTAEVSKRGSDGSVDMGTSYDCFDSKSHTHASGLTSQQKAARALLKSAMEAQGFSNYSREWWHFTFQGASSRSFDIPVRRRPEASPSSAKEERTSEPPQMETSEPSPPESPHP